MGYFDALDEPTDQQRKPAGTYFDEIDKPKPEAPFTVGGVGKSILSGIRLGAEGLAGAGGDLVQWEKRKAAQIARYFGADEATVKAIEEYGNTPETRGPGNFGIMDTPTVQRHTDASDQQGGINALEAATRYQPQNTTEEWANTAGSFLPAAIAPGSAATRAMRVAIPTATTEGAGQTARAMGASPETERAWRIAGAVLGGLGQGVGEAAISGRGALGPGAPRPSLAGVKDRAALAKVRQALIDDGYTPQSAKQAMIDLGADAMIVDLGTNVEKAGIEVSTRSGPGRTALVGKLEERDAASGARLKDDRIAAFGPEVNRTDTLAALKDRAQTIGQKYPAAKSNQSRPSNLQAIADELDSEIVSARGGMKSSLQTLRDNLEIPGAKGNLDPSAEGVHAMRIELDNMIDSAPPGSPLQARLSEYRKKIDAELKDIAPDIKALDEGYSQVKKEGEAFAEGERAFDKGREALAPDEFDKVLSGLSQGEKSRLLEGASRDVSRQIGLTNRELQKLKTILDSDWNSAKLKSLVGDEKGQKLIDALGREDLFKLRFNKIARNSRTAEATEEAVPGFLEGVPSAMGGGAMGGGAIGGATAGVSTLVRNVFRRMSQTGMSPQTRADVGRLLASGRPDDAAEAMKIMQTGGNPAVPPMLLEALSDRLGREKR